VQNQPVGHLCSKQQHYKGNFEVGEHAAYNQSGQTEPSVEFVDEVGDGVMEGSYGQMRHFPV